MNDIQKIQEDDVMRLLRSKKIGIKLVVLWLTLFMACQGGVALAGSDRIFPTGKVTLYRGDKTVGVYTKEAPLPEGSVISTDGRCAVKLHDLYLVAEDQSVFSINTSGRQRNLFIKEGTIYFKTSSMRRAFAFITPNGQISVQRIRLNASFSDGAINGYIAVTENQSELGVAQGGSMDVFTERGPMTIQSGKKIILSQADMDIGLPEDEAPAAQQIPETKPPTSTGRKIVYGALGVAAVAGIALGLSGGGGGGDNGGGSVSPSSP
jgi:ferric-dicitrate binding protein FerR (iron transport regulator)